MKPPDPAWRSDIDALAFRPAGHHADCMIHRLAFRALLPPTLTPTPDSCRDFFLSHRHAFHAAAAEKIVRGGLAIDASLHLTSRDIGRQLTLFSGVPTIPG